LFLGRVLSWLIPFLLISGAYLYAFPQPKPLCAAVMLLHALAGVIAAILLVPALFQLERFQGSFSARLARRARNGNGSICIF